ncbi:probable inactive purple acid phosphatase 1 isoform X2 [Miscanthus floridulus]|uniref:probable inactive purple acid phosphatase 1 isoform X2 n=1 Tax=Miscanthus floridulus TaxID=154761 RepID=UPI003457D87D
MRWSLLSQAPAPPWREVASSRCRGSPSTAPPLRPSRVPSSTRCRPFSAWSDSICPQENEWVESPLLCTAPIKFQFANYTNRDYGNTGKGSLRLQLINQREGFSFALFSGGLSNPKLITHSKSVTFINPKAPVYPRLAQGKSWNEVLLQGQLVGVILVSYTQVFSRTYGPISCY